MTSELIYLNNIGEQNYLAASLHRLLWTTTPNNFSHPNQLSSWCVVGSFNSWLTGPLRVVAYMHWLNMTIYNVYSKIAQIVGSYCWNCMKTCLKGYHDIEYIFSLVSNLITCFYFRKIKIDSNPCKSWSSQREEKTKIN